jgi:hypothetical protein
VLLDPPEEEFDLPPLLVEQQRSLPGCPCDTTWGERFAGTSRCRADSPGTSVARRPCREIDRGRRIFGPCTIPGNCGQPFESRSWGYARTVARRRSCRRSWAIPSKSEWPQDTRELKSVTANI